MRAVVIALLVATIALGAWGVGELHYRNCINAAKASPPQADDTYNFGGGPLGGNPFSNHSTADTVDHEKLHAQVAGCSRIP